MLPSNAPSLNYDTLRRAGIAHLQRLAGHLWTDHNAHDPGVTILEQVCYALTDLAYRIDHSLPDLLAEGGRDPYADLPGPDQMLTSGPVTANDWRKLLIDVVGVKNAWITPAVAQLFYDRERKTMVMDAAGNSRLEPVMLQGLYDVQVVLDKIGQSNQGRVDREIRQRLYDHRGLCEDFGSIEIIPTEPINVIARVEIGAVDDAETVLLDIYQKLAEHISPTIRFSSLHQLLKAGVPIDQIFDGPLLDHGFIDSAQLEQSDKKVSLRTSDFIQEMMDVSAVRGVRHIRLQSGETQAAWVLPLKSDHAPRLAPTSDIQLMRGGLPVQVDKKRLLLRFNNWLTEQARASTGAYSLDQLDLTPGRDRQVAAYESILNQFPAAYGVGELGLPPSVSKARLAQARQLQGYLLFFDQLLANQFAQLANVSDLFSAHSNSGRSYFSQPIDDPGLPIEALLGMALSDFAPTLDELTEAEGAGFERRNRVLTHLLARFGEQFSDYTLLLYARLADKSGQADADLLADKRTFLRDYPRLSGRRGTGINYFEPADEGNISGLQHRLMAKLAVKKEEEQLFIVEHILMRPGAGDDGQSQAILSHLDQPDPYSFQLSVVFPKSAARYGQPDFRLFVERTVRQETPAHLLPLIHWLDDEAYRQFREIYATWLVQRRRFFAGSEGAEDTHDS